MDEVAFEIKNKPVNQLSAQKGDSYADNHHSDSGEDAASLDHYLMKQKATQHKNIKAFPKKQF